MTTVPQASNETSSDVALIEEVASMQEETPVAVPPRRFAAHRMMAAQSGRLPMDRRLVDRAKSEGLALRRRSVESYLKEPAHLN